MISALVLPFRQIAKLTGMQNPGETPLQCSVWSVHLALFGQALSRLAFLPGPRPAHSAPEASAQPSLSALACKNHAAPSYSELLQLIANGKVRQLDYPPPNGGGGGARNAARNGCAGVATITCCCNSPAGHGFPLSVSVLYTDQRRPPRSGDHHLLVGCWLAAHLADPPILQVGEKAIGFGRVSPSVSGGGHRSGRASRMLVGHHEAKEGLQRLVTFLRQNERISTPSAPRSQRRGCLVGDPRYGKTCWPSDCWEAGCLLSAMAASEFGRDVRGCGRQPRARSVSSAQGKSPLPSFSLMRSKCGFGRQRGAGIRGGNDEA